MGAIQYLNKLEKVSKKLKWANRYSDRLVKLSDQVFIMRIDLSKEKEEYWNDQEYVGLTNLAHRISYKIAVLARYGNIMTIRIFDELNV